MGMSKMLKFVAITTAICLSGVSYAFDWYADLGIARGGDKLANVELRYRDGSTDNTNINAGSGLSLSVGGVFELSDALHLQTTVGIKEDGVYASNDSAKFSRTPFDVIGFYNGDRWRLGVGGTYETHISLSGVSGPSLSIDGTTGALVEIDYKFARFVAIGLRYTQIQYDAQLGYANTPIEINGNNTSLRVLFMF